MSTTLRVLARYLKAMSKKLRVFDFDDTLVSSTSSVAVVTASGEHITMDSATFAHFKPSQGDKIDFGGFNDVVRPRKIKSNFKALEECIKEGGVAVILTARPKGAASAVSKFLEAEGVKGVEVVALASSDPHDKAEWISKKIREQGFEDVEFRDDSKANANAVAEYGKEHHKGIKFKATNTPHPKDKDYEGPVIDKSFKSDSPTKAILEYTAPDTGTKSPGSTAPSAWWIGQSPEFKKNYCHEHGQSHYCNSSARTATGADPNKRRKEQIAARAKKTGDPKVSKYIVTLLAKIDVAGTAAGAWLESLEHDFTKLEKKPEGLLQGFTAKDFGVLFKTLFGYDRDS